LLLRWSARRATPSKVSRKLHRRQKRSHRFVGLAVYTSDGEKIGQVTHVGLAGGKPAVRAELGGLGLSPSLVIIPVSIFEQKPDRIELTLTTVEVKDTLSKATAAVMAGLRRGKWLVTTTRAHAEPIENRSSQ